MISHARASNCYQKEGGGGGCKKRIVVRRRKEFCLQSWCQFVKSMTNGWKSSIKLVCFVSLFNDHILKRSKRLCGYKKWSEWSKFPCIRTNFLSTFYYCYYYHTCYRIQWRYLTRGRFPMKMNFELLHLQF